MRVFSMCLSLIAPRFVVGVLASVSLLTVLELLASALSVPRM